MKKQPIEIVKFAGQLVPTYTYVGTKDEYN